MTTIRIGQDGEWFVRDINMPADEVRVEYFTAFAGKRPFCMWWMEDFAGKPRRRDITIPFKVLESAIFLIEE